MKAALFLLAAMALMASFIEADRAKPRLLVNLASAEKPVTPQGLPVDAVARAKFPLDPPTGLDALSYVNRFVNANITGMSDKEQYGRSEMWVMYPESGRGDCDDYVLTKMGMLSQVNFPLVSNARIQSVIVHRRGRDPEGHVVLEILLPSGAIAIMDNLRHDLMTRAELQAQGYEFITW